MNTRVRLVKTPRFLHTHWGLLVQDWLGNAVVYANCPGKGVVRQTLDQFRDGRPFEIVKATTGLSENQILRRAHQAMGRPYDLLNWNCDHFVQWALGNEVKSPQLKVAATIAVVLGIAAIVTNPKLVLAR